jgi:hypothetical protein
MLTKLLCALGWHSWLWHESHRGGVIEHEGWCRHCGDYHDPARQRLLPENHAAER